jgi:hypothetical protein
MSNDEIAARIRIAHLLSSYTYFGDTGQIDRFAALFAEDGVLEVAGRMSTGPAGIAAYARGVGGDFGSKPGFLPARHHVSSVYIELLDPEHAKATSCFSLVSGLGPDHWGRYKDQLVVRDGEWRFAYRNAIVEGMGAQRAV